MRRSIHAVMLLGPLVAWLDSHVLNPVALGFSFLLTLVFYLFYGPAVWIGRWAARRWTGAGQDPPR